MTAWAEKYRPRRLSEVVGNPSAVEELRAWADSFPKHRAAILHGPPGCGKTSAALALASEKGWDFVELNASDKRSADIIKNIVGHAAESEALSGGGKTRLIILDEADNIHGKEDRGGIKAITEIVKRSEQPIVLIANDLHKISSTLRRYCKVIRFRRLSEHAVMSVLRNICKSENLNIDESVLRLIAKNAKGDLRSAINDLQAAASIASDAYAVEKPLEDMAISERDREETIFSVMSRIFHGCSAENAYLMLINLDMTPEDVERWIYENISHAAHPLGMHCMRLADKFIGRTRRTGNFHLWKYASSLMACIAEVAEQRAAAATFQKYRPPSWRRSDTLSEELARKIGEHAHISIKSARMLIPLLKIIFENDIPHAAEISADLNLKREEIMLLTDSEKAERILAKIDEIFKHEKEEEFFAKKWMRKAADTVTAEAHVKKSDERKEEKREKCGEEKEEKREKRERGEPKLRDGELKDKKEERRKQRTLTDFEIDETS